MTGKNNEELLNIYDDQNSDDLFTTTSDESKKEVSSNEDTLVFDDANIESLESNTIDKNNSDNLNIIENQNNIKKEDINKEEDIIEEDIDEWFMDEINELKDDVKEEKKSFFGNFFKKKEKKENEKVEEIDNKEEKLDDLEEESSNIFDDFNQDDSLLEEVDQIKQDRDRDMYYYFSKAWKVLQVIFVLWLLFISIFYSYIYVQNKVYTLDSKDNQLLKPFCFILLNWVDHDLNSCTSIATLKNDYIKKLSDIKNKQTKQILKILQKQKMLYFLKIKQKENWKF